MIIVATLRARCSRPLFKKKGGGSWDAESCRYRFVRWPIVAHTPPPWGHPRGPTLSVFPCIPDSVVEFSASNGGGGERNVVPGTAFSRQPPLLLAAPSSDLLIQGQCAGSLLPGNANRDPGRQRQSCCHLGTAARDALGKKGGGYHMTGAPARCRFHGDPRRIGSEKAPDCRGGGKAPRRPVPLQTGVSCRCNSLTLRNQSRSEMRVEGTPRGSCGAF